MMNRILLLGWIPALLIVGCIPVGEGEGGDSSSFGLVTCSLGCTSAGTCAIQQISQNGDLVFTFSDTVDPASVTYSEFNILNAANGTAAQGAFLVRDKQIIFRPAFIDTPDSTRFGLEMGQSYRVTLAATPSDFTVVRSVSGALNDTPVHCLVAVNHTEDFVAADLEVSVLPNEENPPTSSVFDITLSFNDIIPQSVLLDAEGESPSVEIGVVIQAPNSGDTSTLPLTGTFALTHDLDLKQTTLVFTSSAPFPASAGGTRWVQVEIGNQIRDVAGMPLTNAGVYQIPLLEGSSESRVFTESFADASVEDSAGSTAGLWNPSAGYLDSGLDPVTGNHHGGGSGILGAISLNNLTLETSDNFDFPSTLLNIDVTLQGDNAGVFFFAEIEHGLGGNLAVIGDLPLRLFSRGDVAITGLLDLSGENADVNFGKHRPVLESSNAEDDASNTMFSLLSSDFEAKGGDGGEGVLSGGSGGDGGQSWYLYDINNPFPLTGGAAYYDPTGYPTYSVSAETETNAGDIKRYFHNPASPNDIGGYPGPNAVHGRNGDGVGGVTPEGFPMANAGGIATDRLAGSGMGTWAWPPKSNVLPPADSNDDVLPNWWTNVDGDILISGRQSRFSTYNLCLYRSRGGGGGGYWMPGIQGVVWTNPLDSSATKPSVDPLGFDLLPPDVNRAKGWMYDFSANLVPHVYAGSGTETADYYPIQDDSFLSWDHLVGGTTPDGDGGAFYPDLGVGGIPFYTLDPVNGYLIGGSGGGGAGTSLHGSWNCETSTANADIETFRSCDGAGGGAGGSALQLHVGGDLDLTGSISVAGGDGGDSAFMVSSTYSVDLLGIDEMIPGDAGGGGGSGGALLLQVGGQLTLASDALFLSGGEGGIGSAGNHGGDGGAGILRFETQLQPSLSDLADIVEPDDAVNMEKRPEFGMTGTNWGLFSGSFPGTLGDVSVEHALTQASVFFNGNASGVRSHWMEFDSSNLFFLAENWTLSCTFSDGVTGPQSLVYDDADFPVPGIAPLWIAFQTGWGQTDSNGDLEPEFGTASDWIIPGYNTVGGGIVEILAAPVIARLLRFQIIFDQDKVLELIGNHPNANFRVDEFQVDWKD